MAKAFQVSHQLTSEDLLIEIADENSNPLDPHEVYYAFFGTKDYMPYRVGMKHNSPTRQSEGIYYANNKINSSFLKGDYYCEWVIKRTVDSPYEIIARQEFVVYSE